MCGFFYAVLPADEVVAAMNLMFDHSLTDRRSEVHEPFSNDNPPLEVSYFFISNYILLDDNLFCLMNVGGGAFLKTSQMWFCLMMMMNLPVCQGKML
jgi:hypothetical protein